MHAGFSALRNECSMNCGVRVQLHTVSPALQDNLDRLDELWNEGLDKFHGPFLTGESFCAVDAFFAPVAFRSQSFGLTLSSAASAYAKRLLDLDAMHEWYKAGLQETWREAAHEQEVLDAGVVTRDLRASCEGDKME
jgi:glutathione S-transferase